MKKIYLVLLSLFLLTGVYATVEDYVYVTSKGKCYHSKSNCKTIKKSKSVKSIKKSAAIDQGYIKCKVCY